MSNVISLEQARKARAPVPTVRTPYVSRNMAIDFSDVTQYPSSFDKHGEPVYSPESLIKLGPIAETQVRDMFWTYGLHRMPLTSGELYGNAGFCDSMHAGLKQFQVTELPEMRALAESHYNQRSPGLGDILTDIANGDTASAWTAFQKRGQFDSNARDPDLNSL